MNLKPITPTPKRPSRAMTAVIPPVRVDQALLDAVLKVAERAGTTSSDAIRQILTQWFELQEKKAARVAK